MGILRKLHACEFVGGSTSDTSDVYPVTVLDAIYTKDGQTFDDYLKETLKNYEGGSSSGIMGTVLNSTYLGTTIADSDTIFFNAYAVNQVYKLIKDSGGTATKVSWANVTGKPTTLAGCGYTNLKSDIVSALGIKDWALAAIKPVCTWNELSTKPGWIDFNSKPSYSYGDGYLSGFGSLATKDTSYLTFSVIGGTATTSQLPLSSLWWANINLSTSSSTTTTPTFGSVKIGSSTLSYDTSAGHMKVNTGFYSDTYLASKLGTQSTSDMRLKLVQSYLDLNIDRIADAPSFRFIWKDDESNVMHIGTSAQYWKNILPELVGGSEDTQYSLDYATLGVASSIALAKEVKSLRERVSELEKMVEKCMTLLQA